MRLRRLRPLVKRHIENLILPRSYKRNAISRVQPLIRSNINLSRLHMRVFVIENAYYCLMVLFTLTEEHVLLRGDVLETGHMADFPAGLPVNDNLRLNSPNIELLSQ